MNRTWQPVPGTLARCGDVEVYVVHVNGNRAWVRLFVDDNGGAIRRIDELTPLTGEPLS